MSSDKSGRHVINGSADHHDGGGESPATADLVSFLVREADITDEQARELITRYGDDDPEKLVNYAGHLIEESANEQASNARGSDARPED